MNTTYRHARVRRTDQGELFGVLEIYQEYGVEAKVLRDHVDSVLLSEETARGLVTIGSNRGKDQVFKRNFDITFAETALFVLSLLLAIAIKLDSPGPVLYSPERTTGLDETVQMNKFRR